VNDGLGEAYRKAVKELNTAADEVEGAEGSANGGLISTRSITHDLKRDCEETLKRLNKKTNKVLDELAASRVSSSNNNNNNNNNNRVSERSPTPEPVVELPVIGDGGYLVFTAVSDGTLTLHFSPQEVKESLAYFKPMKIVPAFKYRQNAGRQEIIRKLMNNQRGYYDGFAQFVKEGKEFNADLYLFKNCKARVGWN
jgi:hypothetical protein